MISSCAYAGGPRTSSRTSSQDAAGSWRLGSRASPSEASTRRGDGRDARHGSTGLSGLEGRGPLEREPRGQHCAVARLTGDRGSVVDRSCQSVDVVRISGWGAAAGPPPRDCEPATRGVPLRTAQAVRYGRSSARRGADFGADPCAGPVRRNSVCSLSRRARPWVEVMECGGGSKVGGDSGGAADRRA